MNKTAVLVRTGVLLIAAVFIADVMHVQVLQSVQARLTEMLCNQGLVKLHAVTGGAVIHWSRTCMEQVRDSDLCANISSLKA